MSTTKTLAALMMIVSALACSREAPVPGTPPVAPARPVEATNDVEAPLPRLAPPTLGVAPELPTPVAPVGPRFLSRDGVSGKSEALRYYESLDLAAGMTLERFRAEVLGPRTVDALYRNAAELGFWREMSCSEVLDRGVGGCMVRNWAAPEDVNAAGAGNLGTVAMRLDAEGRAQFYAFAPDGALSPAVILDSEGEKFVPATCTSCHGGDALVGDEGGLGSIFREFEPSLFELPPGADPNVLDGKFAQLNKIVAGANQRVKRESEGAPPGADHASNAIVAYIAAIYDDDGRTRSVNDDAHVPASWRGDPENVELWKSVANPYCMGCHRTNSVDFSDYASFEALRAVDDKGLPLLRHLLKLEHDDGTAVMPQAELMWQRLQEDAAAKQAIENWLSR